MQNYLCLISGESTYTKNLGIIDFTHNFLFITFLRLIVLCGTLPGTIIGKIILKMSTLEQERYYSYLSSEKTKFGNLLQLGINYDILYPAQGWIYSNGLLGNQSWNGTFYGTFCEIPYNFPINTDANSLIGAVFFTGIRIVTDIYYENEFYMGSALEMKIETIESG